MAWARSRRRPPDTSRLRRKRLPVSRAFNLLGPLLEQLALGFADLERSHMAEMAKVVELVVNAFQLRQENAKRSGANRRLAIRGALHGLAIGERMCNGSNRGDPLCHHDTLIRRTAFEAMLEEESRLIVDDCSPR